MQFLVVGCNHLTAPVAVREQVAFTPEDTLAALKAIRALDQVEEVLLLSTCNRTEIYVFGTITEVQLSAWWMDYHGLNWPGMIKKSGYGYTGDAAIRHVMRVACGLDSMVMGEPQILGQIKSAYAVSQKHGMVSGALSYLFQYTFKAAKQVRTQTAIGQHPVSVAFAAVQLCRHLFSHLYNKTALLIGAGNTIDLVYRHLINRNIGHVFIANRTLEHADNLVRNTSTDPILLGDIPQVLHEADLIITSTASTLPILGKGAVERAIKKRKHKPVLIIDIAVPRDVEPEVETLNDVYLYTVDDLQEVIKDGVKSRQEAANVAEKIIKEQTDLFVMKLRERRMASTLLLYRQQAENIRNRELSRALRLIDEGKSYEEVLQQLAYNITNKLIHTPCVTIRKASHGDEKEKINWARELLGIPINEMIERDESINS